MLKSRTPSLSVGLWLPIQNLHNNIQKEILAEFLLLKKKGKQKKKEWRKRSCIKQEHLQSIPSPLFLHTVCLAWSKSSNSQTITLQSFLQWPSMLLIESTGSWFSVISDWWAILPLYNVEKYTAYKFDSFTHSHHTSYWLLISFQIVFNSDRTWCSPRVTA